MAQQRAQAVREAKARDKQLEQRLAAVEPFNWSKTAT